ncbi:UNVERIFIED_CONTAM: hypothetical protein Scaly_0368700 [Sesamum calycinum]|uniref:Methyltransferase type 11 domain-containing protein n=1 Tax=Sesamum calycinum TaxID=2727403 RepID=A0AAW2SEL5_9LAMI
MDFKFLKWHLLRGPLIRRVVLRAFVLVLAVIVVSLMQMAREVRVIESIAMNVDKCPLNLDSNLELNLTGFLNSASTFALPLFGASPVPCNVSENLTKIVLKEMMEKNLLQSNARALHPFFSLLKRRFVYELNFDDNHFDFVFSEDVDRVSVPAFLVLEIERVLRPGGTGAMLVGARQVYSGGLVRSAAPIMSFLKSSDVLHVCGVGPLMLVIFKKRLESFASFEHFQLPASCPSIANNKPFMKYIEPLTDKMALSRSELELSYLPNFMNISSRNKLVYINVGAGEYAKTSVAKLSKPYCANHHAAFDVFIIDHKTSVLSSYVTDPGINFVYHPALSGDTFTPDITSDEFLSAPMDEDGFDFIHWFKETVSDGDFAVLMMNAKSAELNILVQLFETGAICHVDELFLRCSDAADCATSMCRDCTNLFTSLRRSGVYVHQWSGE